MSLAVSQGEGTMVITITSNPKSTWPVLCQILGSLCYGPVCFVSEDVKEKLTDTQRFFGIVQIIFAVMNILLAFWGFIFFFMVSASMINGGGLHISVMALSVFQLFVALSFCFMTARSLCRMGGSTKVAESPTSPRSGIFPCSFPFVQSCNMTFSTSQDLKNKLTDTHTTLGTVQIIIGVMNIAMGCFGFIFSFWIGGVFIIAGFMCVLAVKFPSPKLFLILVILNTVSAALAITAVVLYSLELAMGNNSNCNRGYYPYYSSEICLYNRDLSQMILGGLSVMMIVLSVLQLFVSITFCVLTGKALCKKTDEDEDEEIVKDPELLKPLLEDDTASVDTAKIKT